MKIHIPIILIYQNIRYVKNILNNFEIILQNEIINIQIIQL